MPLLIFLSSLRAYLFNVFIRRDVVRIHHIRRTFCFVLLTALTMHCGNKGMDPGTVHHFVRFNQRPVDMLMVHQYGSHPQSCCHWIYHAAWASFGLRIDIWGGSMGVPTEVMGDFWPSVRFHPDPCPNTHTQGEDEELVRALHCRCTTKQHLKRPQAGGVSPEQG